MQAVLTFPDLSPEIFTISLLGFDFPLRWYALAYIVGILIAWQLARMAIARPALWPGDNAPLDRTQLDDLITWIILGVILGGRLGFVLFYEPAYYLTHPQEILMVWQGGMSFHGGMLGVVMAAWIYALRQRIPVLTLGDLVAHTVPPGLFLGRLANFNNAELWGRSSDLPWAVIFPGGAAQSCPGVEGLCARHPSQLYEALLEGLVLGALLLWLAYRRGAFKRPGQIMGTFFAGYGLARFAVELLRQPDAQFISPGNPLGLAWHMGGYGLTMGQLLSLPMIALGLWFILRARRAATAAPA
ncbi:prolipoprotein diacylglyceryl transferase [Ruegeria sp. 2012CJ41-6]|uniref:Phosphatidylglycerol--prolipoprotein diacylglyceryl transferase n=1 Tax=Ruegeria spongiae TaxID=2942209 RepID=A0ABT0Q388_9RHOB|nr:prolipoprotein diacylglyceryl transferase [Ruegeria spongiae]MCL6283354.1 prolipoprotein diacylglyceryl transferase [Ruegeria spongiae]